MISPDTGLMKKMRPWAMRESMASLFARDFFRQLENKDGPSIAECSIEENPFDEPTTEEQEDDYMVPIHCVDNFTLPLGKDVIRYNRLDSSKDEVEVTMAMDCSKVEGRIQPTTSDWECKHEMLMPTDSELEGAFDTMRCKQHERVDIDEIRFAAWPAYVPVAKGFMDHSILDHPSPESYKSLFLSNSDSSCDDEEESDEVSLYGNQIPVLTSLSLDQSTDEESSQVSGIALSEDDKRSTSVPTSPLGVPVLIGKRQARHSRVSSLLSLTYSLDWSSVGGSDSFDLITQNRSSDSGTVNYSGLGNRSHEKEYCISRTVSIPSHIDGLAKEINDTKITHDDEPMFPNSETYKPNISNRAWLGTENDPIIVPGMTSPSGDTADSTIPEDCPFEDNEEIVCDNVPISHGSECNARYAEASVVEDDAPSFDCDDCSTFHDAEGEQWSNGVEVFVTHGATSSNVGQYQFLPFVDEVVLTQREFLDESLMFGKKLVISPELVEQTGPSFDEDSKPLSSMQMTMKKQQQRPSSFANDMVRTLLFVAVAAFWWKACPSPQSNQALWTFAVAQALVALQLS